MKLEPGCILFSVLSFFIVGVYHVRAAAPANWLTRQIPCQSHFSLGLYDTTYYWAVSPQCICLFWTRGVPRWYGLETNGQPHLGLGSAVLTPDFGPELTELIFLYVILIILSYSTYHSIVKSILNFVACTSSFCFAR